MPERLRKVARIGDKVRVIETCKRGCCVEEDYSAVVCGFNANGTYKLWQVKPLFSTRSEMIAELETMS